MRNFLQSIEQLPEYLSNTEKYTLFKKINKDYPNIDYYVASNSDEYWQGDAWSNLGIYDFSDSRFKNISGLVLSNTCDITPENKRIVPSFINFCLIMSMEGYEKFLIEKHITLSKIQNHIDAIRNQFVSTRFYLPPSQAGGKDYVAFLDQVFTLPLTNFIENASKRLHLRFSQAGFYIFIIKLSWHFCRMGEKIHRDSFSTQ